MGWDFTPATLARTVGRHGWAARWAGTAGPHRGPARLDRTVGSHGLVLEQLSRT